MKKLTKIKPKHFLYFGIIIASVISFIVLLLTIKVEAKFGVTLIAKDYKAVFKVKGNNIYKINIGHKIVLSINDKTYYSKVKDIKYDEHEKDFIVTTNKLPIMLVPHTAIKAFITTDSKKLYEVFI